MRFGFIRSRGDRLVELRDHETMSKRNCGPFLQTWIAFNDERPDTRATAVGISLLARSFLLRTDEAVTALILPSLMKLAWICWNSLRMLSMFRGHGCDKAAQGHISDLVRHKRHAKRLIGSPQSEQIARPLPSEALLRRRCRLVQ